MKTILLRDSVSGEALVEILQSAVDRDGKQRPFVGKFLKTGAELYDPYLIGAVLAERVEDESLEELKKMRVPQQFYGKVPARRASAHNDAGGVVADVDAAEKVWGGCFNEAFDRSEKHPETS